MRDESRLDWPEEAVPGSPVEEVIARVLLWSGLLSALLVLLGLAWYAARGGFGRHVLMLHRLERTARLAHPPDVYVSVSEVLRGLWARSADPLALTALGLVLLMMTPVLGVALAIPAFLREGDRQYAAIAAIVLSMLLVSLLLAGGVI
jgi:uncharacterized membrane protein